MLESLAIPLTVNHVNTLFVGGTMKSSILCIQYTLIFCISRQIEYTIVHEMHGTTVICFQYFCKSVMLPSIGPNCDLCTSRVDNQKDETHTGLGLSVQTTYGKAEMEDAQLWCSNGAFRLHRCAADASLSQQLCALWIFVHVTWVAMQKTSVSRY